MDRATGRPVDRATGRPDRATGPTGSGQRPAPVSDVKNRSGRFAVRRPVPDFDVKNRSGRSPYNDRRPVPVFDVKNRSGRLP
jgi:hypothetical protein